MFDALRQRLRRTVRPGTLALAVLVALAETATGAAAGALAAVASPVLPGAPWVRTTVTDVLLPFLLWLPVAAFALAGFYGALADPPTDVRATLRAFVRHGREQYRRYLAATLASAALGLVLTGALWLVLVAAGLAASTGVDYVRYVRGARFAANPLYGATAAGALLALAALVTSTLLAYTGPLVVQTRIPAARVPLASLRFVRRQPRRALPAAALATLLFALPTHLGRAVFAAQRPTTGFLAPPPPAYRARLLVAVALGATAAVLAATFARAIAGPLLVQASDRAAAASPRTPTLSVAAPGRRTAVLAVVVLVVGAASVGVRVADAHPRNPPETGIDLSQSPRDVYRASLALIDRSERRVNATTTQYYPNGTLERRVTWAIAWDASDHQFWIRLAQASDAESGAAVTYFGETVLARRSEGDMAAWSADRFEGFARTHGDWVVLALPGYGWAGTASYGGRVARTHTNDSTPLRVLHRGQDRLVVGANGTAAAARAAAGRTAESDLRNATFRAVIRPETGTLERITVRGTLVEYGENRSVTERRRHARTVTVRDVGATDVARPAIGPRTPLEWVWDALHY